MINVDWEADNDAALPAFVQTKSCATFCSNRDCISHALSQRVVSSLNTLNQSMVNSVCDKEGIGPDAIRERMS